MRRRSVVSLLACGAAFPRRTLAARPREVLVLTGLKEEERDFVTRHYRERFARRGWRDGRDIALHIVAVDPRPEIGERQVAAAVAGSPAVILAAGARNARQAQQITRSIPIVFMEVADPVAAGLVNSLRRPGGTVTGASSRSVELIGKRFELLRELVPVAPRFVLLMHEGGFEIYSRRHFEDAAAGVGASLEIVALGPQDTPASAREKVVVKGSRACYCFLGYEGSRIMAPVLNDAGIPAVYFHHRLVEENGGLVSLGEWWLDPDNRAIDLAARVLEGVPPSELPVDQLSRPWLAINLATARRMGLRIPEAVRLRANEVHG